jgi:hypothetical protein
MSDTPELSRERPVTVFGNSHNSLTASEIVFDAPGHRTPSDLPPASSQLGNECTGLGCGGVRSGFAPVAGAVDRLCASFLAAKDCGAGHSERAFAGAERRRLQL